jgi:hypothetical protein
MPTPHSDILVHWTGKDIEKDWVGCPVYFKKRHPHYIKAYIERLRDILCHGFWMMDQKFDQPSGSALTVPDTPCLCFTELKLSESEAHAMNYGWLGIGLKRPFLFNRGGRPMVYWGFNTWSPRDVLLMECMKELKDKRFWMHPRVRRKTSPTNSLKGLKEKRIWTHSRVRRKTSPVYPLKDLQEKRFWMHFFKPMNSKKRPLDYDYYSESEWRIVFHDRLLAKGRVKDPRRDETFEEYMKVLHPEQSLRPQYLVPLDGWLAVIICPSLQIKNAAQDCPVIRKHIERLRMLNKVEEGNRPVEMDLHLCRNL